VLVICVLGHVSSGSGLDRKTAEEESKAKREENTFRLLFGSVFTIPSSNAIKASAEKRNQATDEDVSSPARV
jgi:hypothetical protein